WITAVTLIALLIVIAGGVYWATLPPKPEKLLASARSAMVEGDYDAALKSIDKYRAHYAARDDDESRQIQAWFEQISVERAERALHNRFNRDWPAEADDEKTAFGILRTENDGDLEEAVSRWRDLEKKRSGSDDPEDQVWAWLAHKKQQELGRITEL